MNRTQAGELLWSEWQYRHDLFWKSLYRWGAAVITINIVPYVKPELLNALGAAIAVFPGLAAILSIAAAWHINAEYSRLKDVTTRYNRLRGSYAPVGTAKSIAKWRIGKVVTLTFLLGLTGLSGLNYLLLAYLRTVTPAKPTPIICNACVSDHNTSDSQPPTIPPPLGDTILPPLLHNPGP